MAIGGAATATEPGAALMRVLTAAGALLSSVVHLQLWVQGFSAVRVVGPLFLLNAVGGFVVAVAVLSWRHWLPGLAAAGFATLTLAGFYLSVTVGLFGVHEHVGGVSETLAQVAEYVALVAGLTSMFIQWRRARARAG